MKMTIDAGGVVSEKVAMRMVLQVLGREDGLVKFTGGLAVEIKTGKTQKSFKVVKRNEEADV